MRLVITEHRPSNYKWVTKKGGKQLDMMVKTKHAYRSNSL